jgi:UDP-N-acetylglucosamine acyltransferase
MPRVHPNAVVDRHAELADDVEVGAFSLIGPGVRIGAGTRLHSHVVVTGKTTIGRANVLHPFAVVGGEAQILKGKGDPDAKPAVEIGDENVVREHVTIHASSAERATTIGSHNLLMAGSHVAHDVVIGSHCVIANAVQLAGFVVVGDWVVFGGLSGVAQRLRVGESAFVAAGAMCERDVPPFVIVQGDRARVRALNIVGLRRRGVPEESIAKLRRAFAQAFVRRHVPFEDAATAIARDDDRWVAAFGRALAHS